MRGPFSTTSRVLIDLNPTRIDIVIPDGRCESIDAELPMEQSPWREALVRLAPRIKRAVERLGVGGDRAIVVYRSPTQGVGLETLAVSSDAEAEDAALLAVADQLAYASLLASSSAAVIGRDRVDGTVRSHTLAVADHEDTLSTIANVVTDGGLEFGGAVPRDGLLLATTIAESGTRSETTTGHLCVGEWSSYLTVTGPNGLAFTRRISIGLRTLVRALVGSAAGDKLEWDTAAAEDILRGHGIPDADAEVDAERGIRGRQVRARLQSVLQRLVVELRQSLRFGLGEKERADFELELLGPGAKLPGLTQVLEHELKLAVTSSEDAPFWPASGSAGSDLACAVRDRSLVESMVLLPRAEARARRSVRCRRWLWTGAVAAMMLVVVDGFRQHAILSSVQREADVLRSTQAVHEALEATGRRLREAIHSMETLETVIQTELGTRPPLDACLKELSILLPRELRLARIDFVATEQPVTGSLSGFAFLTQASNDALPEFVDAMRSSPLFGRATLGDVAAARIAGRDAMRFQVEFTVVSVPREDLPSINTIASAEVTP